MATPGRPARAGCPGVREDLRADGIAVHNGEARLSKRSFLSQPLVHDVIHLAGTSTPCHDFNGRPTSLVDPGTTSVLALWKQGLGAQISCTLSDGYSSARAAPAARKMRLLRASGT
jgi:hypothetical protein